MRTKKTFPKISWHKRKNQAWRKTRPMIRHLTLSMIVSSKWFFIHQKFRRANFVGNIKKYWTKSDQSTSVTTTPPPTKGKDFLLNLYFWAFWKRSQSQDKKSLNQSVKCQQSPNEVDPILTFRWVHVTGIGMNIFIEISI